MNHVDDDPTPFRSFAIVPAAGHSVRMGKPKLLMEFGGRRLIEWVLSAWIASEVNQVTVVVRQDDRELIDCCLAYPVDVIEAEPPPADMRESLEAGLRHVERRYSPAPNDTWLVAPADLVGLTTTAVDCLLRRYLPASPCVLVPQCKDGRGHPVLLPWSHAKELINLRSGLGLNALIHQSHFLAVPFADASILKDLDTPEDVAEWMRNNGSV